MRRNILIHREPRFWKSTKSVHVPTRIGVHNAPESLFMIDQNMHLHVILLNSYEYFTLFLGTNLIFEN